MMFSRELVAYFPEAQSSHHISVIKIMTNYDYEIYYNASKYYLIYYE